MEFPWQYPAAFTALLLAQLALGVLVALVFVLRTGTSSQGAVTGFPRALATALAVGLVGAGAALTTRLTLSSSLFALLTHAYVALLSLGIIGVVALVLARRRLTTWGQTAAAAAALGLPVLIWASFVEPYALERIEVPVPLHVLREGSAPLRIGVLSDLQTNRVRSHEHAAVDLLLAAQPDVILLPGDLYQGPPERWLEVKPGFRELLQRLVAPGGTFLVPGDCDTNARLSDLVAGTPVQLLLGESVPLSVRDRKLRLMGLDLRRPAPQALTAFARAGLEQPAEIRIALAHRPEAAFNVPIDAPLDLVVAGHTHGGQVRLPGGTALLDLSPVPNRVGGGGLHYVGHQLLYVSRGVGMERSLAPRIRLGCRPEVSLLVLGGEAVRKDRDSAPAK